MSRYESETDIQQVCLNGHKITDTYNQAPNSRKPFCPKCGEKTITNCQKCGAPIKGSEIIYDRGYDVITAIRAADIPTFCETCGHPFPWTEKKPSKIIGSNLKSIDKKVNRKVFIVHGHDHGLLTKVENYLESLNIEPIVLHKQADLGKTIIEKVEHYLESVSFAIILLTADDIGGEAYVQCDICQEGGQISGTDVLNQQKSVDLFKKNLDGEISRYDAYCYFEFASEILRRVQPRSRQNVIFELGLTIGYLGRDRVRVLYETGVELPTDIHGLVYIPLSGDWKRKLAQEINASGLAIEKKYL